MARDIPGYYYDAEKNKYFKIESASTAPSTSAWSSDSVKERRIREGHKRAQRQRQRLLKGHIKRHPLWQDAVSSQLIAREAEVMERSESGRGRAAEVDVRAALWASGLSEKGHIPFVPSFARTRFANMSCFYVGNQDTKTGLGVAYTSLDEETLVGTYIRTDEADRIKFESDVTSRHGRSCFRTEMIRCPQLSSINYHKPSHKILLTSREPNHSCGIYFFSPRLSEPDDERPHWLIGETSRYQRLSIRHRLRDEWLVHKSTPAPASSDLICVVGTNAGVLRVRANETLAWIAPKEPKKDDRVPQEVFDQDFQQSNPNVLIAGGRQKRLWISDLRTPDSEWMFVKQPSSIAHLRSVNPHQFITAGLQNNMNLYDMRFFSQGRNGVQPLLQFSGYKNEAHFHTGWDVCPQLNVVAAAHDDGTVKLFSLRSGRMLRSRALGANKSDTPIRAMMFQRLPRESMSSLFVGEGPLLKKYSFGALELEDEA